ncbi:hypothetical protein OG223_22925 [Streptomyces sp. NBC_01478]|uniref:hypothetical protein n=1 Tax=Streptomyces sp. NBC_01478 TaxID=2903882 RepID=UPI002E30A478|nr:hypothetical protein [Streptomyces sp. NBC_01478]
MATHILMVHTRPAPGQEAAYHHWYDDFHLDEVLQVPGFVAARRLRLLPEPEPDGPPLGPGSHLALFTVESDDIDATRELFRQARKSMEIPSCLDPSSVALSWWRALGPA